LQIAIFKQYLMGCKSSISGHVLENSLAEKIGGQHKLTSLSVMLSRDSRFENNRSEGWSLVEKSADVSASADSNEQPFLKSAEDDQSQSQTRTGYVPEGGSRNG
jgi:hypothetical protein